MIPKPTKRIKYSTILIVLVLVTLACSNISAQIDCLRYGGNWERDVTDSSYICKDPDPEYYVQYDSDIQTEDKKSEGGSDQDIDSEMNCLAAPEDYSWEFIDTKEDEGSSASRCQSNFRLQNTSTTPLILYAYLEKNAGTGGDTYTGYGSGGKILEPGQEYTDNVNHTSYTNGDLSYKRYPKILVLYYVPECSGANPEFIVANQISGAFVNLPDPCQGPE